ncbi:MAG: DinB family protein [Pyrinomonadaceae bacterium]
METQARHFETGRPSADEYDPYFDTYLNAVEGDNPVEILSSQIGRVTEAFAPFAGAAGNLPYSEGKWSAKQVLSHLIDGERVFMYRMLRISRGDSTPLAGFDQDLFVAESNANERQMAKMLTEFAFLRKANLLMLADFTEKHWLARGTANDKNTSVRAIAFVMAGHVNHHLKIIEDRYRPLLNGEF